MAKGKKRKAEELDASILIKALRNAEIHVKDAGYATRERPKKGGKGKKKQRR